MMGLLLGSLIIIAIGIAQYIRIEARHRRRMQRFRAETRELFDWLCSENPPTTREVDGWLAQHRG